MNAYKKMILAGMTVICLSLLSAAPLFGAEVTIKGYTVTVSDATSSSSGSTSGWRSAAASLSSSYPTKQSIIDKAVSNWTETTVSTPAANTITASSFSGFTGSGSGGGTVSSFFSSSSGLSGTTTVTASRQDTLNDFLDNRGISTEGVTALSSQNNNFATNTAAGLFSSLSAGITENTGSQAIAGSLSAGQGTINESSLSYTARLNEFLDGLSDNQRAAIETMMAGSLNDVRAADSTSLNGEIHIFLRDNAAVDPDMFEELRATVTITDQDGNSVEEDWALDTSMFSYDGRGIDLVLPPELNGQIVTFEFYGITASGETIDIGSNAVTFEVNTPEFFQTQIPRVVMSGLNDEGDLVVIFDPDQESIDPSHLTELYAVVTYTDDDGVTQTETIQLDPSMIAPDGSYAVLPNYEDAVNYELFAVSWDGSLTPRLDVLLPLDAEADLSVDPDAESNMRAFDTTMGNGTVHIFTTGDVCLNPDMIEDLRAIVTIIDQDGNVVVDNQDWDLDPSMITAAGGIDLTLPPEYNNMTVTMRFYAVKPWGEIQAVGNNAVTFDVLIPESRIIEMPDVVEITRNDDGELIAVFDPEQGPVDRSKLEQLRAYVTYTDENGDTVTENWELSPYMISPDGSYVILLDDPSIEKMVIYGVRQSGNLTTSVEVVLKEVNDATQTETSASSGTSADSGSTDANESSAETTEEDSSQTVTLSNGTVLTLQSDGRYRDSDNNAWIEQNSGFFKLTVKAGEEIELADSGSLFSSEDFELDEDGNIPESTKFHDEQGHIFEYVQEGFRQLNYLAGDVLALTGGEELVVTTGFDLTDDGDIPAGAGFTDSDGRIWEMFQDGFMQMSFLAGDEIPLQGGETLTVISGFFLTDDAAIPAGLEFEDGEGNIWESTEDGRFILI